MAEHSLIATWARDAVVAGDLEALREPLRALADYHYDSVKMGAWSPWIAELQQAANLTAKSNSIELAAAGVATMGRVCGDCHRALGGGPHPQPLQAPESSDEPFADRMEVHVWAADQLWQGLTAPSDSAWDAGARALAHLPVDRLDKDVPVQDGQQLLELRGLGVSAEGLTSSRERADLYGLLIASCGECHLDTVDHAF